MYYRVIYDDWDVMLYADNKKHAKDRSLDLFRIKYPYLEVDEFETDDLVVEEIKEERQ